MPIYEPFIDGTGHSNSPNFQLDRLQNMLLENRTMQGAKSDKVLIQAPGTNQFYDLGDGPVRGQIALEGYDYIVSGANVWSKDPSDVFTLIGTVANDGMPVRMCSNNTQIFFCSAGLGYVISGGLFPVPSPPWTKLVDVEFFQAYFVGLDDDGSPTG